MSERGEYILPVRFDDTILDGLLPTLGYLDLRKDTPAEVCIRICEKLGVGSSGAKSDQVPPPWSPFDRGVISFDYSSHNGRYQIGQGLYAFETAWSKASDVSIHGYNDPPSIKGLALAPMGTPVRDITDASTFDYTSRTRTPHEGQVVLLENTQGFFAAIRILDIRDNTRHDATDELTFEYWILRDGSSDFSKVEAV